MCNNLQPILQGIEAKRLPNIEDEVEGVGYGSRLEGVGKAESATVESKEAEALGLGTKVEPCAVLRQVFLKQHQALHKDGAGGEETSRRVELKNGLFYFRGNSKELSTLQLRENIVSHAVNVLASAGKGELIKGCRILTPKLLEGDSGGGCGNEDEALVYLPVEVVWTAEFTGQLIGQRKVVGLQKVLTTNETAGLQVTDKKRESIRTKVDG